jgi:hypothetical protein
MTRLLLEEYLLHVDSSKELLVEAALVGSLLPQDQHPVKRH